MKLTFLGTGTSQGIPVIACHCPVCTSADPKDNRLRTSALLQTDSTIIVFDTGPDFRQQMLRQKTERLDAVVLTHSHRDHISGLDDIRSFYFRQRKPFPVFADAYTLSRVRNEFDYFFFKHKYPGVPEVELKEIDLNPFVIGDISFLPVAVQHYQMPVLGFRCGKMAYITDANFIAPAEKEKLADLDVLVLNALQMEPHISHFTLSEAVALVEELKPRRAFFTHISHRMGKHEDVQATLPPNVKLAWDGLEVDLPS